MVFHCDRCGFHNNYGQAMSPEGQPCPVCMVGRMWPGQLTSGFRLVDNAIAVFPAGGQGIPATYQPLRLAGEQHLSALDFFANEDLSHYRQFIQAETVFLGRFTSTWSRISGGTRGCRRTRETSTTGVTSLRRRWRKSRSRSSGPMAGSSPG